jgi:hypothetical protein
MSSNTRTPRDLRPRRRSRQASERGPEGKPRARRRGLTADGVDGNERLTVLTGVVLIVLTAAIGVTIIWIGQLMWLHLFLGLALIGPVALKLASTGYRFVRYYTYDPAYRRKGPPIPALRVLAPLVVFLTAVLLGTGGSAAVRRPRFRAARGSAQDLLLRLDHVHGDPRARPSARDPAGAVELDGLTPSDHGVANRWTGGRATERGDRRSARGWPRACRRATDLNARGPGARDGADRAVLNLDALSRPRVRSGGSSAHSRWASPAIASTSIRIRGRPSPRKRRAPRARPATALTGLQPRSRVPAQLTLTCPRSAEALSSSADAAPLSYPSGRARRRWPSRPGGLSPATIAPDRATTRHSSSPFTSAGPRSTPHAYTNDCA